MALDRISLRTLGLNEIDIADLEKDESLKEIAKPRDLIMSLYLRAIHSEKYSLSLSRQLSHSNDSGVQMFITGLMFGLSIGFCICGLT
jgi:hypothetical protein